MLTIAVEFGNHGRANGQDEQGPEGRNALEDGGDECDVGHGASYECDSRWKNDKYRKERKGCAQICGMARVEVE